MTRPLAPILFLILALCASAAHAEEEGDSQADSSIQNLLPRFKGRAVVMDIDARILENDEITWNEAHQKITIPGRPVEIKLIGENLVIVARFTFIRHQGGRQKFLVAQGQVWTADPQQGIRYQTSVQTIPLEFDEKICYFPLGSFKQEAAPSIEIMLTINPYEE